MSKGKVGCSGPEISEMLYPRGRPETLEYYRNKARFEASATLRISEKKAQGRAAKKARWNKTGV